MPQTTADTASIPEELTKLSIAPETTNEVSTSTCKTYLLATDYEFFLFQSLLQASAQGPSSSSVEEKLLTPVNQASAAVEKQTQPESLPPPIESETDLKLIWIEPNREDYYTDYSTLIQPKWCIPCSAADIISQIPDDWIRSRIFLCVSATQARDLLPHIEHEPGLYRVYVLCQNKAEEDKFRRENKEFDKIRIVTSSQQEFIRQLGMDLVPSFIEIGDITFEMNEYTNAKRWYDSALQKVNNYGGSLKNILFPTINKKIAKCSRV